MSGENGDSNRATSGGFDSWNAYWTAQGMPWRTEPEVDGVRQAYLAKQRASKPDIAQGVYPFTGIKLDRADVEWLLATHESGGMQGPVDWDVPSERIRKGLDLRGAIMDTAVLDDLPLARLQGGLTGNDYDVATPEQISRAALHMEGASLRYTRLEGSILTHGHLEGANLYAAHLESADLYGVYLAGERPADLRLAVFDYTTTLHFARIANKRRVGPRLDGVHWDGVNLTLIDWSLVRQLDDEVRARKGTAGGPLDRTLNLPIFAYRRAVQANRQLAIALRNQGVNEDAGKFEYRAYVLQRSVLWRQGNLGSWLFSWLLALVAGYGYRLQRIVITYVITLSVFALAYYLIGLPNEHATTLLQHIADAYQVSLTAIHGRIFFEQLGLGTTLTWVATTESVIGIVIEAVFTSMLVQRFFAR